MKLRSAGIDDLMNELEFVLDDDGRRSARLVRRIFSWLYRALKATILLVLRLRWKTSQFPALGEEPFNLSDTELEHEWSVRP